MKKQKKFSRKLQLNKETITHLDQNKVHAGRLATVCGDTIITEALCGTVCDCYTNETCQTCRTCTCGGETCLITVCDPCTDPRTPCICQEPLTY